LLNCELKIESKMDTEMSFETNLPMNQAENQLIDAQMIEHVELPFYLIRPTPRIYFS
jgi:hypothetical protein